MEDTILVSYVKYTKTDTSVLIVGRKRLNQSVEIINAFDGDTADELYNRLITKESKNDQD